MGTYPDHEVLDLRLELRELKKERGSLVWTTHGGEKLACTCPHLLARVMELLEASDATQEGEDATAKA